MGTVELTGLEMMFKTACVRKDSNCTANHLVGEIHSGQAHLGKKRMCQPKGHVTLLHSDMIEMCKTDSFRETRLVPYLAYHELESIIFIMNIISILIRVC